MSNSPEVLIVGAGPTGLTLACELAWRQVRVRIVDEADGPVVTSNALGVMPRTLELLEHHGVVTPMLERGVRPPRVDLYVGGRRAAGIDLDLDGGAYPSLIALPQRETERLLVERLGALGVTVEWRTRAERVTTDAGRASVRLRGRDGADERLVVPWLVGCDGVGSTVRASLDVPFDGEAYREAFNLADLAIDWPLESGVAHAFVSGAGLFFAVPLPGDAPRFRLIIAEPRGSAQERRPDPDLAMLDRWLHERTPPRIANATTLHEPEWSSRFRIQRRVVPSLRHGPVLLAGDAAHVHSPAGAQGMNTGIHDAVNLGWKLAAVQTGQAPASLLDSYDAERLPVARAVIGATHGLTTSVTSETLATVAGRVMGALLERRAMRRRVLASAYGMLVQYRRSPIVAERTLLPALRRVARLDAPPRPGDRAPDVIGADGRLYRLLMHPDMTLLAFVRAAADHGALPWLARTLRDAAAPMPRLIAVGSAQAIDGADAVLADADGAIRSRYRGDRYALQLIRPDRHVAWRGTQLDADAAAAALARAYGA